MGRVNQGQTDSDEVDHDKTDGGTSGNPHADSLAASYTAPVQSVNNNTGAVSVATGGVIPSSQTVASYSDLPLTDRSQAELWFVSEEKDIVASTALAPVVWRSLSDYTIVSADYPDSVKDSIISIFRFDEELDSTSFKDSFGTYDGTLYNGAGFISDAISGKAVQFDQSNDEYAKSDTYVDPYSNGTSDEFSVEGLVRAGSNGGIIMGHASSSTPGNNHAHMRGGSSSFGAYLQINSNNIFINSGESLSTSTYKHVAYTVGPSNHYVYLNGTQVGSGTYSNNLNDIGSGPFRFASRSDGGDFSGDIDRAGFYDKRLTESEINDIIDLLELDV